MMELGAMRLLVTLSATGSVTATADVLDLTASAVSQQIRHIERLVGQPITRRNGRGIELTDHGRLLAAKAGPVVEEAGRFDNELAAIAASRSKRLSIAGFESSLRTVVPNMIRSVLAAEPDAEIAVVELEPDEAMNALRSHTADVAVLYRYDDLGPNHDPAIAETMLWHEPFRLVGTAVTSNRSIDISTVQAHDWLLPAHHTMCGAMVRRALATRAQPFRSAAVSADFTTLIELSAAGLGTALVPATTIPSGVRSCRATIDGSEIVRTISIAALKHRRHESCITAAQTAKTAR